MYLYQYKYTFHLCTAFGQMYLNDRRTEFFKKNSQCNLINTSAKYLRDWSQIVRVLSNSKQHVKHAISKENSVILICTQYGLHLFNA